MLEENLRDGVPADGLGAATAEAVVAESPVEGPHVGFYRGLSREEVLLIEVRDELYNGESNPHDAWERIKQDLTARKTAKPYIFKLVDRIERDIRRVEKLDGYETMYGVYLGKIHASQTSSINS